MASADSSASSPPVPPAPPLDAPPFPPAWPPAVQVTSAAIAPGGPVKLMAPGVVYVLTAAAGNPANAPRISSVNPAATVAGCGSGPCSTRAASVADGVNSHDGRLLFCWEAGAGM